MICPNCETTIFDKSRTVISRRRDYTQRGVDTAENILVQDCPECDQYIVEYELIAADIDYQEPQTKQIIWPKVRPEARPVPPEVPAKFAEDYTEACLVLEDSPKASAALSRRCLQLILRDKLSVTQGTLYSEIQEAINRSDMPSHISDTLDNIRTIGNFAAHPNKYNTTGEIVPVEQGEAEWCLELIEELFDFCFVAPARAKERQKALDAKFKSN